MPPCRLLSWGRDYMAALTMLLAAGRKHTNLLMPMAIIILVVAISGCYHGNGGEGEDEDADGDNDGSRW